MTIEKHEAIALNHYLSAFPENLDFWEILEILRAEFFENGDDGVTICEAYEDQLAEFVAEEIEALSANIKHGMEQ